MIKKFHSLSELLISLPELESNEWIYTEIATWNRNPAQAVFYYIPWEHIQELPDDEIYLDSEEMEMPKSVEDKNLCGWMVVCDLSLFYKIQQEQKKTLEWIVEEIDYYREYDAFRCLS